MSGEPPSFLNFHQYNLFSIFCEGLFIAKFDNFVENLESVFHDNFFHL